MRNRIRTTLAALRRTHAEVLAPLPVAEIVDIIDAVSRQIESMCSMGSRGNSVCPATTPTPLLPHSHTSIPGLRDSLAGLLPSLRREALWRLLEEEFGDPAVLDRFQPRPGGGCRRALAPAVTAHFFAGNTPLLSWPSLAASLLVKSASFGKLSRAETEWPRVFTDALAAVHPGLARCIALDVWPGGTRELDSLLCAEADAVIAYGADTTLAELRALTPAATPYHDYGHRVSLALVARGADAAATAAGLARDVLFYDQQGCLSAAMVFVEGTVADAARFGECLARALAQEAARWSWPPRDVTDAAKVRATRQTALFAPGARVWGDPELRWTVLLAPGTQPEPTGGACVLPLHPLTDPGRLPTLLAPLRAHLQGAALAAPPERRAGLAALLAQAGINRICAPGQLQAPPFSLHQDGRQVLAPLVRWSDLEFPLHVS